MINKIILIGRLTRDPELKHIQEEKAVARFTLAVDRGYKDQTGKKPVDFIDIVAWNKLGEICANNLGKGRLVAVEGRLQIRSYETDDGSKRKVAEVVADAVKFLDYKREREPGEDDDDLGSMGKPIEEDPSDLPF